MFNVLLVDISKKLMFDFYPTGTRTAKDSKLNKVKVYLKSQFNLKGKEFPTFIEYYFRSGLSNINDNSIRLLIYIDSFSHGIYPGDNRFRFDEASIPIYRKHLAATMQLESTKDFRHFEGTEPIQINQMPRVERIMASTRGRSRDDVIGLGPLDEKNKKVAEIVASKSTKTARPSVDNTQLPTDNNLPHPENEEIDPEVAEFIFDQSVPDIYLEDERKKISDHQKFNKDTDKWNLYYGYTREEYERFSPNKKRQETTIEIITNYATHIVYVYPEIADRMYSALNVPWLERNLKGLSNNIAEALRGYFNREPPGST